MCFQSRWCPDATSVAGVTTWFPGEDELCLRVRGPLSPRPPAAGEGDGGGSVRAGPSSASGGVRFTGSAAAVGRGLEGGGHRPHWCCCPVTCGRRCRCGREAEACAPPPLRPPVPWAEAAIQAPPPLLPRVGLPSVFPPTLLDVQGCGILSCPRVSGRGTSVSCGCFTGYGLKGRDPGHFPCPMLLTSPTVPGRPGRCSVLWLFSAVDGSHSQPGPCKGHHDPHIPSPHLAALNPPQRVPSKSRCFCRKSQLRGRTRGRQGTFVHTEITSILQKLCRSITTLLLSFFSFHTRRHLTAHGDLPPHMSLSLFLGPLGGWS